MSNALAIAGVTAVLKDLLTEGLINHDLPPAVGAVKVTAVPPDTIRTETEEERLNLFLYRVSANQGWRNNGLPSRDASGARLTNPPLALDLHYLLSAYSNQDFHSEILLGYAMQVMHETPVLTRDAIRKALGAPSPVSGGGVLPAPFSTFAASDLADQVEQIKLTPQQMNSEEMSKLWSAMQAHYRPSAAYHASVVLIESRHPTRQSLPVRARNLLVRTLARPFIEAVSPQMTPPGGTIRLRGYNLRGEITRVKFGEIEQAAASVGYDEIQVTVPASLRAGVNTLQVLHKLDFGTAVEPHRGFESNVVAFMLQPEISGLPASLAPGGTLTFDVSPAVAREQRVELLLDDKTILLPARAPGSPPATSLGVAIPGDFPPGTYLVRVAVDGAVSALEVESDAVQPDPIKKQFIGPKVTIS